MTWVEYHKQSEQLAGEAEVANYKGETGRAQELYRQAAELEEKALSVLDHQKIKTLGITAVSAAALWYKAGQFQQARKVIEQWLASGSLPAFAVNQLDELLRKLPPKAPREDLLASRVTENVPIVHYRNEPMPAIVEAHLRADPNLTPEIARTLSELFRTAYEDYQNMGRYPDSANTTKGTQSHLRPKRRNMRSKPSTKKAQKPRVRQTKKAKAEKRQSMNRYQVIISWDDESESFVAEAPELPGCAADGATWHEALSNIEVIIDEWLETARKLKRSIPQPKDHRAVA